MFGNKSTIGVFTVAALFATSGAIAGGQMGQTTSQSGMLPYLEVADANKDNSITEAEFSRYLQSRFKELDTNGDGNVAKAELKQEVKGADGADQTAATFLALNDLNRDNKLTYDEYVKEPMSEFALADSNGDRKVSMDEAKPNKR